MLVHHNIELKTNIKQLHPIVEKKSNDLNKGVQRKNKFQSHEVKYII